MLLRLGETPYDMLEANTESLGLEDTPLGQQRSEITLGVTLNRISPSVGKVSNRFSLSKKRPGHLH